MLGELVVLVVILVSAALIGWAWSGALERDLDRWQQP